MWISQKIMKQFPCKHFENEWNGLSFVYNFHSKAYTYGSFRLVCWHNGVFREFAFEWKSKDFFFIFIFAQVLSPFWPCFLATASKGNDCPFRLVSSFWFIFFLYLVHWCEYIHEGNSSQIWRVLIQNSIIFGMRSFLFLFIRSFAYSI